MATNNVEDELRFRESDFLEIEDEPSPDLNRALNLTLAGKLLATNRPSLSNMTFYASRTWDCPNRVSIFDHGRGLYSFQFVFDSDVLRVIKGGPWFIEGKLLLVQRVNPNLSITNMPIETTKIWVRCFDLPPKAFNIKFAKAIGNMLGCFCESDLQEAEGDNQLPTVSRLPSVRKFMRIKVNINLSFPLKKSQVIRIRNNSENKLEEFLVKLAYERLPALFCYKCGLLGHDLDKCAEEGPILYGDWIRSEMFYRIATNGVETNPPQTDTPQDQTQAQQSNPPITSNQISRDPNIILANFKDIRALGPLPTVPLLKDNQHPEININALVPFDGSSTSNPPQPSALTSHKNPSTSQIIVPVENNQVSILGAIPSSNTLAAEKPPPAYSNKPIAPTYFNASVPSSDLFSPNTQRCLFKSELVHPTFANQPKSTVISPPNLSPLGSLSTNQFTAIASGSENNKGPAGSRGKRALTVVPPKGVETPKPKRGRPPSGAAKNA